MIDLEEKYINEGFEYYEEGKDKDAISVFKKALSINPNNRISHSWLGMSYLASDNSKEAIKSFIKALSISCDMHDAYDYLYLGMAFIHNKQEFKGAISLLLGINLLLENPYLDGKDSIRSFISLTEELISDGYYEYRAIISILYCALEFRNTRNAINTVARFCPDIPLPASFQSY
jgi:tetratricopeptide (TPR) repeat protein